jgi:hypothetical protein
MCCGIYSTVLACAGLGPRLFLAQCWTCQGPKCEVRGDTAILGGIGTTNNLTTRVSLTNVTKEGLAGTPFFLTYTLSLDSTQPNAWQAVIGSIDGSFNSIVLDPIVNSPGFSPTLRRNEFCVPRGTTAFTLTFAARHVRIPPPNPHRWEWRPPTCSVICMFGVQLLLISKLGGQLHVHPLI